MGKETEGKGKKGIAEHKLKVSRWDEERRGEEEKKYVPVWYIGVFFILFYQLKVKKIAGYPAKSVSGASLQKNL